jgi:hypothetical protein
LIADVVVVPVRILMPEHAGTIALDEAVAVGDVVAGPPSANRHAK